MEAAQVEINRTADGREGSAEGREAYRVAWEAFDAARTNLRAAQAEFDTTPAGQRVLNEALADPACTRRGEYEHRLQEAVATATRQKDDLRAAREAEQRLAHPSPEQQQAMLAADEQAIIAQQHYDVAAAALAEAEAQFNAVDSLRTKAFQDSREDHQRLLDAEQAGFDAAMGAMTEAKRLYIEAGVDPRYAGYYAADMVDTALGVRGIAAGRRYEKDRYRPAKVGRLKMKVKRNGSDADLTRQAAVAAQSDDAFTVANDRVADAATLHGDAVTADRDAQKKTRQYDPEFYAWAGKKRDAEGVERQARQRLTVAKAHASEVRARVGADAPVDADVVSMGHASGSVMRNPDGSVNAWVYSPPVPGLPYGRYVPVVGLGASNGMSQTLKLRDGRELSGSTHYFRSTAGAQSTSHDYKLLVSRPKQGARPLVEEALTPSMSAGFFSVIDSGD